MAIRSVMSCNNNTRGAGNVSGKQAEALAARYLEQQGLQLVARNVRCRGGEIDLVCRDGQALVFVEVRLRRHPGFGGAAASITRHKQQRVILAARHYLATQGCADSDCRFDCILLDGLGAASIEWIRDAFAAD
jgi:putative endonuclease